MSQKCRCSVGCQAEVKTAGRKYARGHNPACHRNYKQRGKSISRTVRAKYVAGYVNPFTGREHTETTKRKMRRYQKNRTDDHQKHLQAGIDRRSSDPRWLEATRRNAKLGSEARRGMHDPPEVNKRRGRSVSKTRRRMFKSGELVAPNKGRRGVQVAWNKGRTKKTDRRVAAFARSLRLAYADGRHPITSRPDWRVWYRGPNGRIHMRSGFELAFAQWMDRKRIPWQYEPHRFAVGRGSYTPDFYLPKRRCYVEVKGYFGPGQEQKISQFRKQYPYIELLVFFRPQLQALGVLQQAA